MHAKEKPSRMGSWSESLEDPDRDGIVESCGMAKVKFVRMTRLVCVIFCMLYFFECPLLDALFFQSNSLPFSQEQVSKGLHSTDWWEGEEVTACGLHAAWLMLSLSLQGPNYGCVTQEEVLSKILQILLRPVRGHPWTWLIVASHVHNRKAFGQSLIDKALFKPMRICFIQNILQFTFFQVLNGSGPATSLCETFLYHIFWWLKF